MKTVSLVFPHQLFKNSPLFEQQGPIYLVEEWLFFCHYGFHKQKIAFHRASMQAYGAFLEKQGYELHYIEAIDNLSDVRQLIEHLASGGVQSISYIDPTDDWLSKRIKRAMHLHDLRFTEYENPLFLNSRKDLSTFFRADKSKFYQTSFYKSERQRRHILIDEDGSPTGGKWTYDKDNRKKYPSKKTPPPVTHPRMNVRYEEAVNYVNEHFSTNPGDLSLDPLYPLDFETAEQWLEQFIEDRLREFGAYEDAIVRSELILHHSVLTPVLNVGLILPGEVLQAVIDRFEQFDVPINSVEGFVRQIIGWREFIRGVYIAKGVEERTRNFWGFHHKIPQAFYTASTGIEPVDETIRKVLKTGYCHHIERLMILGNFMLLCELDPDEVYRWFMELFIDAYDWVMVPNVYGMSQFADGGLMSTKPYISGSNYLKKMSDYENGPWQAVWDGLFWRFLNVHRSFFESNPRLSMLLGSLDRMSSEKFETHMRVAEDFLSRLHAADEP